MGRRNNMKKDSIIINALILFCITLIAGLLLGLTYNVTKEPIAYQTKLKTEIALNAVLAYRFSNPISFNLDKILPKPIINVVAAV